MCICKSIHRLWILFVSIRFASEEPKQRTIKAAALCGVKPVCESLPQPLSLHIVDVLVAVGGVNDLGTGINKGINLFAFQRLHRSFHCLIAHVVAELGTIHAERTVLDGGDSRGIAVKTADDGIGIRLLSINAEKLHFSQ